MGKIKWYKRDPDAALSGMMELSLEERGAYNTVLDLIYSRANHLPDDERFVAGWLRCDVRVWKRIRSRLIGLGKLYVEDGMIHNARADREVDECLSRAASVSDAARIKGIKSGAVRRKNKELSEPRHEPGTNTTTTTTRKEEDSRALGPDRPYFPDPEITPTEPFIGDAADGARAEKSPQFPQPPLPVPGGFVEEPVHPITPPRSTARQRKSSPPPGAFDRFWSVCPRKIGRKACEAKFAIAARTVAPETLIDAMQRYADRCREQGTEERYIAHPLTWLNQGRWEDGVAPAATSDDATDAGRLMRVREILSAGGVTLSTVPGWASMTEAQARAHCEDLHPTAALALVGGQRMSTIHSRNVAAR